MRLTISILWCAFHIAMGIDCDSLQLTTGRWNATSDEWLNGCTRSFSGFDTFLNSSVPLRVIFLGDSNMLRTFSQFVRSAPCVEGKHASRCTVVEYMNLQRADTSIAPNLTIEGPHVFGLTNPWCNDCSGCDAQLWHCSADRRHTFEYISMEFYNDVEFQTKFSRTTQAAIFNEYVKEAVDSRLVFVVSGGTHDMALPGFVPSLPAPFRAFFSFLNKTQAPVLWMTPTHLDDTNVPVDYRLVTNNQRARIIRDSLLDFLREMKREAPWLHPLDTYQMSEGNGLEDPGSLHSDHVHLSGKGSIFYVEVVRIIKELLQKVVSSVR